MDKITKFLSNLTMDQKRFIGIGILTAFKSDSVQFFGHSPLGTKNTSRSLTTKIQRIYIKYMFNYFKKTEETKKILLYYKALRNRREDLALDIINKSADIHTKDSYFQKSFLHWAVYREKLKIVQVLVDKGADVTARDKRGETPIHIVSPYPISLKEETANMLEIYSFLLDKGADVHIKNDIGETALHKASQLGYVKLASLFIQNGADVNARNINGQTPLHLYSFSGKWEMAELLIRKGADTEAKDVWGFTPLYWVNLKIFKYQI